MKWKIFSMEWKWNGGKLPVWNMEKSSSIPFHTMPWSEVSRLGIFGKARADLRGLHQLMLDETNIEKSCRTLLSLDSGVK